MKIYEGSSYNQKRIFSNISAEIDVYCCEKMKEAFDERFIVFGEFDSYGLNRDKNVNITHCYPYPEGAVWDEMAIKFCPFCAEQIEIIGENL